MRRRVISLLLVLWLCLLCACSEAQLMTEDSGGDYIRISCEAFTGERIANVTVSGDAYVQLNCELSRTAGHMTLVVTDQRGTEVYRGNELAESGTFTVRLNDLGDYTISIQCRKYSGKINLTWETMGAASN